MTLRRRGAVAAGYGNRVKIHDDLRSALVHEVVEQMNETTASASASLLQVADAATSRKFLFASKYSALIKRIRVLNPNAAFADADTDIAIAYVANGNFNPAAPVDPTTVFKAEGFDTANLPAFGSLDGKEFAEGTNTVLLSKSFSPFVLPKGSILYAEFVNNEGAARDLEVVIEYATTDRLELQPRDLSRSVLLSPRNFQRTPRRAD